MSVSTGIRVDLTALTKVLTDLRRDVDRGMQSNTRSASSDLGDTARFGTTCVSGEVVASTKDISYAASIAGHNAEVHIENALGLADLIQAAVMSYRAVDAIASGEFARLEPRVKVVDGPAPANSAGEAADLTPGFVGPLPSATIPDQRLTSARYCTNWGAYDTPRLWSMVKDEVTDAAWDQMHAFRRLGDALDEQHRRLIVLRENLRAAWSPSESGAAVVSLWDDHISAVASDAACAQITSIALNCILDVLSETRSKMQRQRATWDRITTDYMLEAWDHKAQETDDESRKIMADAERAIRDYRQMIKVPEQANYIRFDSVESSEGPGGGTRETSDRGGASKRPFGMSEIGADGDGASASVGGRTAPPPMPGAQPAIDGPGLSGSPIEVPLSPRNPPSLLPIPPGVIPNAPSGGAYILPGPWSGVGRILPMLPAGGGTTRVGTNPPSLGGSGTGVYGYPPLGSTRGDVPQARRQRMATEQWEAATGVPPVIGTAQPWYLVEEEKTDDPVERLEQWIKVVGMPWDLDDATDGAP